MCFHSLKKKMGVESKKLKNNDFRHTGTWNEELVICVFAVKRSDVTMPVNARNCLKDTTLTTHAVFFGLLYFHLSDYNKYFVRYLQIKSSLVLITNYSIVNACNRAKDTKLTTRCFWFALFSFVLLQQVFWEIPANQMVISSLNW